MAQYAPGLKEFGVDVSKVGKTEAKNRDFVRTLTPEQQAKIKEMCVAGIANPDPMLEPVLVVFCKSAMM